MDDLVPVERIVKRIFFLRGHKVMLDNDLAELYEVKTKSFNQAVKRNSDRFPADFMFQLTTDETIALESEINNSNRDASLRSQFVTLKRGRGQHRKYQPFAFTEQGVAMLSSVLRSKRAAHVNIGIMRAFVTLREMLSSHKDLARKLEELEKKYDTQFKIVFDAIRELMTPPPESQRKLGFRQDKTL